MTEKGLRRDINYREQFFDRDNHWLSETIATYAQVFAGTTSARWRASRPTSRGCTAGKYIREGIPTTISTARSGIRPTTGLRTRPRRANTNRPWCRSWPPWVIRRRPLFPGGQRAPRRLFKAACEQELRLVPLGIGIVETLVRKILPECRPRQGFRPGQVPRRLGPHR